MNPEMMEALTAVAAERGVSVDTLFAALAEALEAAYKKQPGAYEFSWVNIDTETGEIASSPRSSMRRANPSGPSST
ncbi:MAG: NusA N-terminal domain-containing protein [Microthrixaceae bacterium]